MTKHYLLLLFFCLVLNSYAQTQIDYDETSNAIDLENGENFNSVNAAGSIFSPIPDNCNPAFNQDVLDGYVTFAPQYTSYPISFSENVIAYSIYMGQLFAPFQICQAPLTTGVNFITGLIPGETCQIRMYVLPNGQETNFVTATIGYNDSQMHITTDTTAEDLVTRFLKKSPSCLDVSNISMSTGTNYGNESGIGYFYNGFYNNGFPFERGIILSTGRATAAYGNQTQSYGTPQWQGDDDIEALFPEPNNTNASLLEFDFIARDDMLSLEYLFASEEYHPWVCTVYDRVAILLTDTQTSSTTNIAVVPGTNIPVSVASIRNVPDSDCSPQNPEYFDAYYATNSSSNPLNFKGVTVPLTAQAALIPGNSYHIKFVIADTTYQDNDSAIIINAESLNFIGDVQTQKINSSSIFMTICPESSVELSIEYGPEYNLQWYNNNIPIIDATAASITTSEPGLYSVKVSQPGNDCMMEYFYKLVINTIDIQTPTIIYTYDENSDGFTNLDVTDIVQQINSGNSNLMPEVYEKFIYSSEAGAEAQEFESFLGSIDYSLPYTNISNPQTLYLRTNYYWTDCYTIQPLTIQVLPVGTPAPMPFADGVQYLSEGQTLQDLEIDGQNIQYYADAAGTIPLPPGTVIEEGATYYITQTIDGQESETFAITIGAFAGIDMPTANSFTAYPNPVNDVLTISATGEIKSFDVYNVLGQLSLTQQVSGSSVTINMQGLQSGVYTVKVSGDNGREIIKVVKQ